VLTLYFPSDCSFFFSMVMTVYNKLISKYDPAVLRLQLSVETAMHCAFEDLWETVFLKIYKSTIDNKFTVM